MKKSYNVSTSPPCRVANIFTTTNDQKVRIYDDGHDYFLPLTDIYHAIGFSGNFSMTSALAIPFKTMRFTISRKRASFTREAFVVSLNDAVPYLCEYAKIMQKTNSPRNSKVSKKTAINNINQLINQLNQEILPKFNPSACFNQNETIEVATFTDACRIGIAKALNEYLPPELYEDLLDLARLEGSSIVGLVLPLIQNFVSANAKLLESYRDYLTRPLVIPNYCKNTSPDNE